MEQIFIPNEQVTGKGSKDNLCDSIMRKKPGEEPESMGKVKVMSDSGEFINHYKHRE